MRPLATLACALLGLLPAATSAAAPETTAAPRQFLWEVSSLTNKVYLYGTVHAGKASFYPLPQPVERAFADSRILAVEADITDAEAMTKGSSQMVYAPPDSLSKHIPAPLHERLRKQLQRFSLPEAQIEPVKPFFAASLLVFNEWFRQGYTPDQGVDLYLIKRAKAAKMSLVELEGAQAQTELMATLSEKEGVQALEGAVTALESGLTRDQITGVVNAWQAGDPSLLLEVTRAYTDSVPGAKELEEKFIWSRHEAMAGKIEAFLLSGRDRAFVAVGALHLAGPRGLLEILMSRGYFVRQL